MIWEDLAIKLGVKAVEKFFANFEKKEELVSPGVAVGYFYNFIDPMSQLIEMDHLEVFKDEGDGTSQKFKSADVRLQVIVPKQLSVTAFKNCENEFGSHTRGKVNLARNKRIYGINYFTDTQGRITIVDLARPIMSVKRFYEDIQRINTSNETDTEWLKTQLAEITAFKETLNNLQKRGYGTLVNQLYYNDIG